MNAPTRVGGMRVAAPRRASPKVRPPPPRMLPLSLLILASAPYFFTFHSFSDHLNASTAFFPGYFVVELSNLPTLSNEG